MPLPNLTAMLQELIAAPSVSSSLAELDQSNYLVIATLGGWLEDLGFKVELCSIPNRPSKYNLIATKDQGQGKNQGTEGLILAGHSDTVPYDPLLWTSDPLKLTERDGRLYGLGISDMKGFFAIVIEALRNLNLRYLRQPLTIIATADEESSMCGAQDLLLINRPLGKHVLIGEPTNLYPIRMHKGIAMESVRIIGRSAHSSNPASGNNAIDGMYLVLDALQRWRTELQTRYHNPAFEVPVPTLNFGRIHGGDSPNRICGHCELHFDLRPLPGMNLNELRAELESRLCNALTDTKLDIEITRLFEGIAAMETPVDAPIVKAAEALTGHTAGAVAFGTEAPYFERLGMQSVILGPGSIDQAHQPDEFLSLANISPYISILQGLVKRFCL